MDLKNYYGYNDVYDFRDTLEKYYCLHGMDASHRYVSITVVVLLVVCASVCICMSVFR